VDAAVEQLLSAGLVTKGQTLVVVSDVASGDRIVDGVKIRVID
jgi:hypothetical protein